MIGERDGYYMLGFGIEEGYIRKEDIKEVNQKWIRIGEK